MACRNQKTIMTMYFLQRYWSKTDPMTPITVKRAQPSLTFPGTQPMLLQHRPSARLDCIDMTERQRTSTFGASLLCRARQICQALPYKEERS